MWQWQIGALAVFMAYINFILLLKGMPWLGIYINMLLKIVIEFMKLILLPFFLILHVICERCSWKTGQ